mmetsp:Transcript_2259/g.4842  ORF Transcript_2259/g.4842 Transcript_2259/m.4842 type:complete len:263 (-) Transcript_2259:731-1519(-)
MQLFPNVAQLHRNSAKDIFRNLLDSNLIIPSLCNVPDPSTRVVPRLIEDTKKANMDTTGGKHRNLELGVNRRPTPRLGAHRRHQVNIRMDVALRFTGKTLDTPYNRLLFWFVLCATKGVLNLCLCGILWDRYFDNNVCSKELIREISNHLHIDGNFCQVLFFLNSWNDAKRQIDIVGHAISHELKLAIRGNKGNRAIRIEFSESNASMEGTIVDLYAGLSLTFLFDYELVVETKFTIRHSRQFRTHLHRTRYFVSQDGSSAR